MALSCNDGTQPDWCPRTTDEVLPSVIGLLPPGPAWEGAGVEGTVQNAYWRAYANVLSYTYGRLCDYVDEFFCHSVKESLDQWIEEYGLNDPCDPYGHNLCIKVAAQGGATCDYFVEMAALSGWVITCDTPDIPDPIAGCFEVGCTPLGPTPTFAGWGTNIGYGQRGACEFGEINKHPDPDMWENGKTNGASCKVPGSNLGWGPDTDESCCFIVGYYEPELPTINNGGGYCQNNGQTIFFECPRRDVPPDTNPNLVMRTVGGLDASGSYSEWGHTFLWEVTVDMAASQAAQALPAPTTPPTDTFPDAGEFMVGDITLPDGSIGGTPLCFDNPVVAQPSFVLCFLERIKPAHTTLNVKVLQP